MRNRFASHGPGSNLVALTRRAAGTVVLLALALAVGPGNADEPKPAVLRVAGYDYALPAWWDAVKVEVPQDLQDWMAVSEFVNRKYGNDTGTKDTWKEALKTWAIACQRLNNFPVYLAHCHRSGGEYRRAAEIYVDLYKLADTQKDLRDWYRTFLAYNVGEVYEHLKETEKAVTWYAHAAEYVGHKEMVVDYYARKSAEKVAQLKQQ